MKRRTITIIVLGIFAYAFFRMWYYIDNNGLEIKRLIAMVLILVGAVLFAYSEMKKMRK